MVLALVGRGGRGGREVEWRHWGEPLSKPSGEA